MDWPLIRILVADAYPVVRSGLHRFIGAEPGLEVCGEAGSGHDAVQLALQLRPDLVLLDPAMQDLAGTGILDLLRIDCPESQVLIFSLPREESELRELILAGAKGCVFKNDPPEIVISAIRALHFGRPFFSPALAEADLQACLQLALCRADGGGGDAMTPRQLEVVRHLAEGLGNKEVAQLLGISIKTVETHRATIMRKIGARSAVDLVRYAIRHNLSPL
ncbi:response regulator transcription factor [Devosia sp. 1566]|jgi:DNA-binding NarL/FixJ family response regulator|uniref:LuxR C-terminal-related transcriptional regulator n=1 Tax=Devosia sp. 1566 TaxID=2499144 RepID=UPI000FD6F1EC|nr:response regulator transcription factor [Devosia sp. 1566]